MMSDAEEAELALRINAALMQFWTAEDTADELRAIEIETWLDALDGCTVAEFKAAWRDYQRSGPRSARGVLLRPDAGAIWKRIVAARPRPLVAISAPQPEAARQPVTAQRAREIMAEVYGDRAEGDGVSLPGYEPRRFDGNQAEG